MKQTLTTILALIFVTATFAADDAKELFYKVFTKGDKKSLALLHAKFPSSEYSQAFKLFDAVPDKFDEQKTPAALKMADALVARAPTFEVAYLIRATLHFDLATHDLNNERSHAAAMTADLQKADSLGLAAVSPKPLQGQVEMLRCFGDYIDSRYQSALAHCDAGLKIDRGDEQLHRYRALTLYMMQDFSAAVKSFDKALKNDPNDTYLLNLRGLSKLQSQDFKGALADATSGKKIDANMVEFVILSGRAKVALNNRKAGCVELRSAAAMGQGADAQVWLNELCQ